MRWMGLACIALTLVGCVASTEVKTASSDVGVALKELSTAQAEFRDALIAEIEEIRQLIASSVVNGAVNREVAALTEAGFFEPGTDAGGDHPADRQGDPPDSIDLISLSDSIKNARDAAEKRVEQILELKPPAGEDPDYEAAVAASLEENVEALQRTAERFGDPELHAAVARARAAVASDEEIEALAQLLSLQATKGVVTAGMSDLADYIKFLRKIHAPVNQWVSTDVTVKGDELAALIDKHAGLIGLGDGQ